MLETGPIGGGNEDQRNRSKERKTENMRKTSPVAEAQYSLARDR